VCFFSSTYRIAEKASEQNKKIYEQSLLLAYWRVWKKQRKTKVKKYEERNTTEKKLRLSPFARLATERNPT
jgi:hypothetical protein